MLLNISARGFASDQKHKKFRHEKMIYNVESKVNQQTYYLLKKAAPYPINSFYRKFFKLSPDKFVFFYHIKKLHE